MNLNNYIVRRDYFSVPAYQVLEKGYLDKQDYYVYLADTDTQVLTLTAREIDVITYQGGDYLHDQAQVGKAVVTKIRVFDALVIDPLTMYIGTMTLPNHQLMCVEH